MTVTSATPMKEERMSEDSATDRGVELVERYGNALISISAVLSTAASADWKLNRVRLILAGLATDPPRDQSFGEQVYGFNAHVTQLLEDGHDVDALKEQIDLMADIRAGAFDG